MNYPAFTGLTWIVWTPLPGLDSSLGEHALRVAAVEYARALTDGMSEVKSHQMAEKVAFEVHYRTAGY